MKKISLATILALSTAGVVFLANAETDKKPEGFLDPSKPVVSDRADQTRGDRNARQSDRGDRKDNRERKGDRRGDDLGMLQFCRGFMPMHMQMLGRDMMMPMMGEGFGAPKGGIGGFVASKEPVKVNGSDKWEDDSVVVLQGNITKQVGRKDFVFKDDSGELTLEIDRKAWHGELISPQDKVKVIARVEKSFGKLEVEAFSVENLDKPKLPPMPKAADQATNGKPVFTMPMQPAQQAPAAEVKPAQ